MCEIPNGKTCTDCNHWSRCQWLVSAKPDWNHCDFEPSRFSESMISKFSDCIQENKRLKAINKQLLEAAETGLFYAEDYLKYIGGPDGEWPMVEQINKLKTAIEAAKENGENDPVSNLLF